jgi:lipoprotein-anchoring transpeptidase ErfK/SrfK
MPSKTFLTSQALSKTLNQAYAALQCGDKREARHWAHIAASMEPNSEEPWLILAAASQARASIEYLKRALEINPQSERARGGLEWATRRLNESINRSGRDQAAASQKLDPAANPKPVTQTAWKPAPAIRIFLPILLLSLALLAIAAWTFRPGIRSLGASPGKDLALYQEGSTVRGTPTNTTMQTSPPLPTDIVPPSTSATPTAFQPVADTPTPNLPTATVVQSLNGLREGEFFAAQLPAGGEKVITVSLQDQRLTATQGGTLVANFVVSTGKNTRAGNYHILDKLPNPYSELWRFWMPNWMGIYYAGSLENGFHSLPVLPDGETIWGDALGTAVSYGCVVLGEPEAQALYEWAEVGTTVQINP